MRFRAECHTDGPAVYERVRTDAAGMVPYPIGLRTAGAIVWNMHRFINNHRGTGDPPAWDIIFDLFPEDREAMEKHMMGMLEEVLLNASR